jgi:sugar-specific transcriptional regulator TrmB
MKEEGKHMAQKKATKDPFSEFLSVFENQKREMEKLAKPFLEYPKQMEKIVKPFLDFQQRSEKMAKPILEYHQKLLEESKRFQEVWARNFVETTGKLINQMIEEQRRQAEETSKLLSEMKVPNQAKEYIQGLQKIQEKWIEQMEKAIEMLEGFAKTKEKKQ